MNAVKKIAGKTAGVFNSVNLANKLTILRLLLVPLFVVFLSVDSIQLSLELALAVFIAASVTDWLDGHIARTRLQVTALGQFLDPIADKILVMAALVCFVEVEWVPAWTVVAILSRDFIVGAVRLVAVQSTENLVIPARASGKVKTVFTMFTIIGILCAWMLASRGVITFEQELPVGAVRNAPDLVIIPITNLFMYLCVALTLFSGGQYVKDSWHLLKEQLSVSGGRITTTATSKSRGAPKAAQSAKIVDFDDIAPPDKSVQGGQTDLQTALCEPIKQVAKPKNSRNNSARKGNNKKRRK
jgi:CDP-diacylglycerol--glycerol-3-phosphate 3-phosphatidyltransferase